MLFNILTIFPEKIEYFFSQGLVKKAIENKIFKYKILNIREYGLGKYRKVDDYPYGGGNGMLLRYDVLKKAFSSIKPSYTIHLSPRGELLTQKNCNKIKNIALEKNLCIICGAYEGIDQRFIDNHVDLEISIGNYVIHSGETACTVLLESIIRLLDGFMENYETKQNESFMLNNDFLLEYDQYTRPIKYSGNYVPEILYSGNHSLINKWQHYNQLFKTFKKDKKLLFEYSLNRKEADFLLDSYFDSR